MVDKVPIAAGFTERRIKGRLHPLDSITHAEVSVVREAVKKLHSKAWFKAIAHKEPPKKQLVEYLEADRNGKELPFVPRLAYALFICSEDQKTAVHELVFDLDANSVLSDKVLEPHLHCPIDYEEYDRAEGILKNNPEFKAALKAMNFPENGILQIDPWIYGADSFEPQPRLITFQCYMRDPATNHPDSNHYSFPIPMMPVMNLDTFEILTLGRTPCNGEGTDTTLDENPLAHLKPGEYIPELLGPPRADLKPLTVQQPEGPSFKVEGQRVFWQKWDFRIGFNYREGLTIHDVYYDGRSIAHRISFSEMTVPYADPRSPFHRKQAFDFGDVGAGVGANTLSLGCDCLGVIKYFSGVLTDANGEAREAKDVICMHEVDVGLMWKHTNYRTNRAGIARNRQLVVQMMLTIDNYEYLLAVSFDQAAGIHIETRATGILSTCYIKPNQTSPYGTIVGSGVLAANHQHVFAVRIDPAVDGHQNSLQVEESVPMPAFTAQNPHGVGYLTEKAIIKKAVGADLDPLKNRTFKVINPNVTNPISKTPVGYKLHIPATQLILAHPDSVCAKRAEFAEHHLWVTKHHDNEFFAGGNMTNQSCGKSDGVRTWVAREDAVENEDIVLYACFTLTHNPRVEDWPVMPVEIHQMTFKPSNFFNESPAMDIPQSTQAFNKSTLVTDEMLAEKMDGCCKN